MSVDFIDSNIFVYLFDETAPDKQTHARDMILNGLGQRTAVISYQVVQETLNVLTRKLAVPLTTDDARDFLDRVLMPLWHVLPGPDLYHHALAIQGRYQYGFYDSLIIAGALSAGCARLYSEDMQAGQRIESMQIINPFND